MTEQPNPSPADVPGRRVSRRTALAGPVTNGGGYIAAVNLDVKTA